MSGEYFERTRRYFAAELVRALAIAAMVAATGRWFGRPLDELTAVLIALAGANLAAAAVWAQAGRRLRASSIAVRAAIRSRAS